MIKHSKIAILIPIYNEEETLHHLFYRIKGVYRILKDEYFVKFIFVNDGSVDDSGKLLETEYKEIEWVEILHHEVNSGYGWSQFENRFRKSSE